MKRLLLAATAFLIFACNQTPAPKKLNAYLPQNSAVVIQSPDFKNFSEEIGGIDFFSNNELNISTEINEKLDFLKYADTLQNSLLAFSEISSEAFIFTFISESQPEFELDSVKNKSVETFEFDDYEIQKITIEDQQFFTTTNENGIFISSNNQENLKNILLREEGFQDIEFERALKAVDSKKNSLLLNHRLVDEKLKTWFPGININFGTWSALDLENSNGSLKINGLSLWGAKKRMQHIFEDTGAETNRIAGITPLKAAGLTSFSYRNFEKFQENLKLITNAEFSTFQQKFLANSTEFGSIQLNNKQLLAFNSRDIIIAEELLGPLSSSAGEFREIPIFTFKNSNEFAKILKPLISVENLNFYLILDNFIVFAETIGELEEVISAKKNNNSLAEQSYYQDAFQYMAGASNILMVANLAEFKLLLRQKTAEKHQPEIAELAFENYRIAALQVVAENGYSHLHGILNKSDKPTQNKIAEQLLSIDLDAAILSKPQLVKNHLTNDMDIAVQDINNVLYLISNTGKTFWKKQVDGPILGEIKQVDLLKNGRFQLAFVTSNQLQVLDRNGNPVKPFPLKFKDEITQPLSLFDYDNNRNYRFLITQNNQLYMYDGKGRSVKGFGFNKTGPEVILPPKHIRMGNKDYIVIAEDEGKLNILDRQGNHRISVKESLDFSENEWYQYNDKFISSSASGTLISIDQRGSVKRENLNLAENHKIVSTSNLLVSLSENVLKIKEKEINLDFGLYTEPQIFLINDIYYISVTDLQTQKVFIYNSNAELLPGFPVYGTSQIDINNADPRIEFTVKGEEREILLYRF